MTHAQLEALVLRLLARVLPPDEQKVFLEEAEVEEAHPEPETREEPTPRIRRGAP